MYKLMGMGLAAVAFIATAILFDQLIARGFLETCVPGAIAAYFTYNYFAKKDAEELMKILNPPVEVWPVPFPVAWGCIKDVLDTATIATGVGGASTWRIQREDDSRGLITAQLNFSEHVGGPTTGQVHPRTVGANATLTAEGGSTRVLIQYQVFSPMGEGTVKKIVQDTHAAFQRTMIENKDRGQ